MKSNPIALFSVFLCLLFAGPPMVSAADNGEVFVVAMDDVGISNYMKSEGDGTFTGQEPIGQVSGYSYGNGLGDFDNDGDLDYITATGIESGSIYLFEKLGPGNDFAAPRIIGSWGEGYSPADIVVADFNEDNNLDFILTHYGGIDCELYAGKGNLAFTHSLTIDTAYFYSIGADVADFNNDGHADFIVAPYNNYSTLQLFYVNLGRGDGTFETIEFKSHASAKYWGVAAGDFNSDEITDLVATYAGFMDIYYGLGDGQFEHHKRINDPNIYYYSPVDNYDFNADGIQDIVIGTYGTHYPQMNQSVAVFFGDGKGGFTHSALDVYGGGSGGYRFAITAPPFVPDNKPPVAIVDPADQEITSGEAATFIADASYDEDGEIVSYQWDFGDQSLPAMKQADNGPTVEHTFYAAGLHTVTLTVTDNKGATNSAMAQVQVVPMKANVRFAPKILRLTSRSKWAGALIRLPEGYDASNIDPSSICIVENQTPVLYASFVYTSKRIPRCKVKFDRQALMQIFDGTPGRKTLQIRGKLSHKGGPISFEGSDSLCTTKALIIKPQKTEKKKAIERLEKKRAKLEKLIKTLTKILCSWYQRHR